MLHILDHPVDDVSLGFLADLEHEAYQELAVTEDPDWESEVRSGVKQGQQTVHRILHCKTLCLIVGLLRASGSTQRGQPPFHHHLG